MDWFNEGKTVERFLGIKRMISINPFLDYKGCFFLESRKKVEWLQDQVMVKVNGEVVYLRKWPSRENSTVLGKFRRG